MNEHRRKLLPIARFLVALTGILMLGAWLADRPPPVSPSVQLLTDKVAIVGEPLGLRVEVARQDSPGYLVVDLHWSTVRREPRGFLAGVERRAVGIDGGSYALEIAIPAAAGIGFVHPVIYFGPTNSWDDRTWAVRAEPIDVGEARSAVDHQLVRRAVYDAHPNPSTPLLEVAAVRWLTALAWLLCAVVAFAYSQASRRREPCAVASSRTRWLESLAAAAVLAAGWEASSAVETIGLALRQFALAHHLYYERESAQKLTTVAIVSIAGTLAARIRPELPRAQVASAALISYLALVAIDVVSWNPIDRVLHGNYWNVPLVQWLKLLASVACIVALFRALFRVPRAFDKFRLGTGAQSPDE